MKILKTISLRPLIVAALFLLPASPASAENTLIGNGLKVLAVVIAGIGFFALQKSAQKPLVRSSIAGSSEYVNERARRKGDYEKALSLTATHKKNIQLLSKKMADAQKLLPSESSDEKISRLRELHTDIVKQFEKIAQDTEPISEEELKKRFAEIEDLYIANFKENAETAPYFKSIVEAHDHDSYSNVIEGARLSRELRMPLNKQALQKKCYEIDAQIDMEIDKKATDTVKRFEENHPTAETVLKSTPTVITVLGGVVVGGLDQSSQIGGGRE